MGRQTYVGVVGPSGEPGQVVLRDAEEVGRLLAAAGVVVVTGGGTGVMAAASRGATAAGGTALGLLPGPDRSEGNPSLTLSVPTGLGELRTRCWSARSTPWSRWVAAGAP